MMAERHFPVMTARTTYNKSSGTSSSSSTDRTGDATGPGEARSPSNTGQALQMKRTWSVVRTGRRGSTHKMPVKPQQCVPVMYSQRHPQHQSGHWLRGCPVRKRKGGYQLTVFLFFDPRFTLGFAFFPSVRLVTVLLTGGPTGPERPGRPTSPRGPAGPEGPVLPTGPSSP